MIHAYHVVLPMHGFWLPNDPRGSWSEMVRKWELVCFGPSTKSFERRSLDKLTPEEIAQRDAARKSLRYPPARLTDTQIEVVGEGFSARVAKSGYTIWACSILPEHSHLVIARHVFKVEQIVILLKGAATRHCSSVGFIRLRDMHRKASARLGCGPSISGQSISTPRKRSKMPSTTRSRIR